MNKRLRVLLLSICIFLVAKTNASHMMGADMSYKCLGGGKYLIVCKVYRDCRGISLNGPDFGVYAGTNGGNGCGGSTLGITRTDIRDVTPKCSTATNPCSPKNTYNTGEGIEEHTFETIVDFNTSPLSNFVGKSSCCEVTFYCGQSARNGAITTGAAGQYFVTTCMINICNIPKTINKCNSSPDISNEPVGYLCCNEPFCYNNGAVDTVDFDSISYRLAPALQGIPNISVTYSSPFSYQYPLTVYCIPPGSTIKCTPNTKTNPPRGFYFDSSNGDICCTPIQCGEGAIIVVEMTEWRKDSTSGKYIIVGKTRRDMQFWVKDDCDYNKAPTVTGPSVNKVCEGDKICFEIEGKDETFTPYQTIPDTVQMKWNNGIPGGVFKILNPTDREKKAQFCWQTKVGQASDFSYSFTVTATDEHCLKPSLATRGFKVKVNPRAFDERKYTILKCGRFAYEAKLPSNFKGVAQYKWSFRDSTGSGEFYFSSKQTDTMVFKKGGRYIVVHTVNNSDNCPTIYRDTIDIPNPPTAVLATADTFACFKTKIKLEATVLYAKMPYKYYWTRPDMHIPGDTLKEITLQSVDRDSTITVRVSDGDGCVFYDTAKVLVKPLPTKPNIPDQRICTYDTAVFDALHADSMYYLWNSGERTRKITRHIAGDFSVTITDTTWGCIIKDTAHLYVNDTVVALAGADKVICTKDSFNITANHRNSALSALYSWTNNGTVLGGNKAYMVQPKNTNPPGGVVQLFNYELWVRITQVGLTCEDRDTMTIKVNALPVVAWTKNPLDPRCHDYCDVRLDPFVARPYSNLWKDKNIMIWGVVKGYGNVSGLNNDGLVDSISFNNHHFRICDIDNEKELSSGKNVEDVLWLWHKDTNGCVNIASTKQRVNGNPVIVLDTSIYCQDKGWAKLDSSVIRPKTKFGTKQKWELLEGPGGADLSNVIRDISDPLGIDWEIHFGDPTQNEYAGEYKVKFSVTDQVSGCFAVDTTLVKIITEPTVAMNPPGLVCLNWDTLDLRQFVKLNGFAPQINGYNKFKILEYKGDRNHPKLNAELVSGYKFSPSNGAGDWLIKFSSDETGCLREDSFTVNVVDTPNAQLLPAITLCSQGPDLDLNTRVTNVQPASATRLWKGWNVNSGTSMFTPASKDSATLEGPYINKLELTNSSGCKARFDYPITIRSMPQVSITTNKPLQGCERDPYGIQSAPKYSNNGSVLWSLNKGADGNIDNVSSQNIIYKHGTQDAANKYAWLKVSTVAIANEVCPQATDSIQIILHLYPKPSMAKPYDSCVPFAIDFQGAESKGIPANQLAWYWDFGNGQTSQLQNPTGINFPNQGKYTIKLVVANTAGPCIDSVVMPDYVLAYPNPVANFVTDPPFSTTIALPKFKMFNQSILDKTVFTGGSMRYHWNFDDPITDPNDTSSLENPRYAYGKDTNTYNITLTVTSDHGCVSTFTRPVVVGPDIIIYIPDVFTPDGAGPPRNNTFKIYAENYKALNIRVYNRWGEKLYETEDLNKGWDGTANGQPCQQEVYVYKIEVLSLEGKLYKFDGTITLLR